VTKATGARVQTTVNNVTADQLGECEVFEEKQVGNERFNLFRGCPASQTCTMVLRGGAEQFIEEAAVGAYHLFKSHLSCLIMVYYH
jgi:T-complex protein 1 subunit eta